MVAKRTIRFFIVVRSPTMMTIPRPAWHVMSDYEDWPCVGCYGWYEKSRRTLVMTRPSASCF